MLQTSDLSQSVIEIYLKWFMLPFQTIIDIKCASFQAGHLVCLEIEKVDSPSL